MPLDAYDPYVFIVYHFNLAIKLISVVFTTSANTSTLNGNMREICGSFLFVGAAGAGLFIRGPDAVLFVILIVPRLTGSGQRGHHQMQTTHIKR